MNDTISLEWTAEELRQIGSDLAIPAPPPADPRVLKALAWLATHDEVWDARGHSDHTEAYLDATSLHWRERHADPADSPEAITRAIARHAGAKRLRGLRQWHDQREAVEAAATLLRHTGTAS